MIRLSDFGCMRRGQQLAKLTAEDISLTSPLNIVKEKKERALLLLHGFTSTPAVFRNFIQDLECYDALMVPLLPTHGENIDAFATMQGSALIQFVEDLTATLVKEYEQVDILGLSLGGLLALHLANSFPIRQLFLLAPALDLHLFIPFSINLAKVLQLLGFRHLRSFAGNICREDVYEIAYRQLPLPTIIELLSLIKNFPFKIPDCQTDLFLGSHDDVVASAEVAARFKDSKATIHWLENSCHVLSLDNDWQQVLKCIKERFPK